MLHLSAHCTYYFCTLPVDMRKGFDSLSGLVQQQLRLDALGGSIFIFLNRKRSQAKLLLWEGDGFALYYKRLEKGAYDMPAAATNANHCPISAQQLQFILQGVQLKNIKMKKRYQRI